MDLDPMKRRSVTRLLAAMDTILGLCIFILQIYRIWEFYYPSITKPTSTGGDKGQNLKTGQNTTYKPDEDTKSITMALFVVISILVFATKALQIFMGFGLLVATFGRNLQASIGISTWWLRTSVFIIITLVIKLFFIISNIVVVITELLGSEPFDYGLTIFGMIFRLFSAYWVTRFIIFLQWQAEFESYSIGHHRT